MRTPPPVGQLITIFLFFALVAGIIGIYWEELLKMEFFARLQTTPISNVEFNASSGSVASFGAPSSSFGAPRPTIGTSRPTGSGSPSSGRPSSGRPSSEVRFGDGRIVDAKVRPIDEVTPGEVIHTITSNVTDYYASGFLEEAEKIYDPSPFAGRIIFHDRTSGIKQSDVDREYFILLASNQLTEKINITDWKIFDREEKISYKLPKGIRVLGSDFGTKKQRDIEVESGDTIFVSSGKSPAGFSFRVNKCSGYRSQFKTFVPTIKTDCPDPLDEFLADGSVPFSDSLCYDTVDRLRSCAAVADIPALVSNKCEDFLEDVLTESGCVDLHRNDADFFESEIRIFLGQRKELWENRDNVLYLLDNDNKLVATLVYR